MAVRIFDHCATKASVRVPWFFFEVELPARNRVTILCLGFLRNPAPGEEILQQHAAFRFAHSARDITTVIQRRALEQIHYAANGAALWITRAEHDP